MAIKQPSIPPIVDPNPGTIAEQTRGLLHLYLKDKYQWGQNSDGGEVGRALTEIFAHYCGLIADRINRAPEKNFLAFLDLLGNSLIQPTPAEVPVTFFMDPRATEGFNIAAGARLLADPINTSGDPVPFETSRDLWLTTLKLTGLKKGTVDIAGLINNSSETTAIVFGQNTDTFTFEFTLPVESKLPANHPATIYFSISNSVYDPRYQKVDQNSIQPLDWQYSINGGWQTLIVEDETQSLTQTGNVAFLVPADLYRADSNSPYRIQVSLKGGATSHNPPPVLQWVALNTVTAVQLISVHDEIIGSSNGNPNQTLATFRKPVLEGAQLQVMERAPLNTSTAGEQSEQDLWVDWIETKDFYDSKERDRHYLFDHNTGEVRFGDGISGMIPPLGIRNIRMHTYQSGGGRAGNVLAGSMKTLVSGANKIEKVTNLVAASGGADIESYESLLERAPKALRHRGYSIAKEDYEDLAKSVSTEVARVLCVPLINLADKPSKVITTLDDEKAGSGIVSVIIVPNSRVAKPLPSQVLLRRVEDELRQKSPAGIQLFVVGPLYLRVDITLSLKLESLRFEDRVKHELDNKLTAYLHPLTGRDGQGWSFGRKPHESDIYRLLDKIPGIDYVKSLKLEFKADDQPSDCGSDPVECIEGTGRFLIYSGSHRIDATL